MSEEVTLDDFGEPENDATQENQVSRFWGKVPEGWQLVDGSEVYEVNPNPKSDEEPSTYIEMDALDTELPYPRYFGKRNASEYSGKTFTTGDTLFARITPCTENGKAALVPEMDTEIGIGSTEYAVLSPKRDRLNPWLLYYLAKSHPVHNYAVSRMRGSTGRQRVPFSVFRRELDIALPPLTEQRKIATVLYTVDQAIEKTSEIIERMETTRRGTEQTLLSRGLLEDGTLRNEGQIEYKNSWVGEVPKNWSVQQYSELITDSSVGIVVKPSQYYDDAGEVPILRSKDISRDGIVSGDFEYMTQESNKENSNSRLEAGDVITVRSGEPGLSCVVSEVFDGANCADLLISTPGENLDPHYAAMWINSRAGKKQIDRFQAGLAQKHFNLGALRKMRFAVPEIEEQRRIVEKVGTITESLDREKKYNTQLRRVKRSLMQDLLSGTVRTTDTTIEVPEEIAQYG